MRNRQPQPELPATLFQEQWPSIGKDTLVIPCTGTVCALPTDSKTYALKFLFRLETEQGNFKVFGHYTLDTVLYYLEPEES